MTATTHRLSTVPRWHPAAVFLAIFAAAIVSARLANTTWEWDSLTRAEIARYLDDGGLRWYFVEAKKCVWLPLWPMLTVAVHRLTGLPHLLAAEALNAVAAGLTGVYLAAVLRRLDLPGRAVVFTPFLLLTMALWLSYAGQGMTDVFAAFLFFATVVHFWRYLAGGPGRHLVAAALLSLVHAGIRYEAFLLLAFLGAFTAYDLFRTHIRPSAAWRYRPDKGPAFYGRIALFALPTVLFFAGWCAYCHACTGSMLASAEIGREHAVGHPWATTGNVPLTAAKWLLCLLLATGPFGIAFFVLPRRIRAWRRPEPGAPMDEARLLLVLLTFVTAGHAITILWTNFAGLSVGWPRFYFCLIPIALLLHATVAGPRWRRAIVLLALLGIPLVYAGFLLPRHRAYVEGEAIPEAQMEDAQRLRNVLLR